MIMSSSLRTLTYGCFRKQVNPVIFRLSGFNYPDPVISTSQRRCLFTDEVLGVDRFVHFRDRVLSQFGRNKEKFLERLEEHLKKEDSVVLSEDLKNLIFLCENNENDINLLKQAINKFEKQNESLRFGTFQFGPVVMRLAHHLNQPDMALSLMEKDKINFYSQLSSVTISLDLLFKNERYEDVVKLFTFVTENYKFDAKYPNDFVTLYMAACYKINTLETFDQSYRLLRALKLSSVPLKIRSISFFLALAVNQNQPNICLEIIQQLHLKSYSLVIQSIRLLAFAQIERYKDVCDIIKYNLRTDRAVNKTKVVFQESLNQIEQSINASGKEDVIQEFANLVKNLDESGLIEKEQTIDQALMQPLEYVRKSKSQPPPKVNFQWSSEEVVKVKA